MKKTIGLSRRDLEWIVMSMTRSVPKEPEAAQKLLFDVVMTMIERNNAAITRELERDDDDGGKG